jgi:hypothetical protein
MGKPLRGKMVRRRNSLRLSRTSIIGLRAELMDHGYLPCFQLLGGLWGLTCVFTEDFRGIFFVAFDVFHSKRLIAPGKRVLLGLTGRERLFPIGCRLSAIGYRLSAIGYWLWADNEPG